jgi:hypothetical protein
VFFINGYILSSAVNLTGGGVYHAFDTILHCRLTNIERAIDIGVNVTVRCNVGVRDGNQCSQMENDVHFFGDLFAIVWIPHIATQDFHLTATFNIF